MQAAQAARDSAKGQLAMLQNAHDQLQARVAKEPSDKKVMTRNLINPKPPICDQQ